jgi:hypothetical protein
MWHCATLFAFSLVALASSQSPPGMGQQNDWLVMGSTEPARVIDDGDSLTLTNGLILRTLHTRGAFFTTEYLRTLPSRNFTYLRAPSPEGSIALNGTTFAIGGCPDAPPGHAEFWNPARFLKFCKV